MIDFLLRVFSENQDDDAIVWRDETYSYQWLLKQVKFWREVILSKGIPSGAVVTIEADFSPNSIALFLVLVEHRCILVPLTNSVKSKKKEFIEIAQGEYFVRIADDDSVSIGSLSFVPDSPILLELKERQHPGLILFSSGSTGKSKAAVHDLTGLLEKFKVSRHKRRAITFLLYDHIGGVNTMLYLLSNSGCIVTVQDRSPDRVLSVIERYKVELLPTSPTFMNLILLSEAYKRYDLSSLKIVTYGTEPMPESTLKHFHELFPHITLLQTYGLSEVGILRSKSKDSSSLWVKIGGEGFDTRIVNGILQIKAQSAMLGYLNAPSPFIEDGWFDTGDSVEVDGEYMRILGRKSEIINVGGEKVYPAEVESVIQAMDGIAEVTVYGEKNPIIGNIVCAKVRLSSPEDHRALTARVRKYCQERLARYKIPSKVLVDKQSQHSARFKKVRFSE